MAGVFATLAVTSAEEVSGDRLEVRLIAVVVAPYRQDGLTLDRAFLAAWNRLGLLIGYYYLRFVFV